MHYTASCMLGLTLDLIPISKYGSGLALVGFRSMRGMCKCFTSGG